MALSTIQNNSFADTAVHGYRNLVTNGACTISQRGTSVTGTSSAFLVDRWKVQTDTAATYEQVSDAPTGFTNSLKFTNTTASSSSTSYREIRYVVEAQDLANSGWNYTSSSAYMSFSFWVKSSVAQTMSVLFRVDDTAINKYFSRQFTINSANTWEYKTMTIFGDSGLTVNNDNGAGLSIFISPFYGTNYASASSDGVWESTTSNAIITFDSTWASTTNSTIQITGVQLELGSEATPFEHRQFGDELARCQRYFIKYGGEGTYSIVAGGTWSSSSNFVCMLNYRTEMRGKSTVSSGGNWAIQGGSGAVSSFGYDTNASTKKTVFLNCSGASGTSGNGGGLIASNDANAYLYFDAEL